MRRFEVHFWVQGDAVDKVDQIGDSYKGMIEDGKIAFYAEDWAEAMVKADSRLEGIDSRFLLSEWRGVMNGVINDNMEADYYNRHSKDGNEEFKAILAGYFRPWEEPEWTEECEDEEDYEDPENE